MRVTNGMMTDSMLYNLNRNLGDMAKYQWQSSTGKKIQYASDDPLVASRAMKFRTDVNELKIYEQNASDAQSWLHVTEDALTTVNDILQRVRELTVGAATATQTTEDKQKTMQEVKQLREELIRVGNSTYAGKFIFSGNKTNKKLFNEDGTFNVDINEDLVKNKAPIQYNVGVGVQIDVGTHGISVFGVAEKESNKFVDEDSVSGVGTIKSAEAITADDYADGLADEIAIEITLNGTTKIIDVGTVTNDGELKTDLQTKIDAEFGAGKIVVDVVGGEISLDNTTTDDLSMKGVNKYDDTSEMVQVMDHLIEKMEAGDEEALSAALADIDEQIENLLINRAEVGAKDKRTELTLNRIKSDVVTFTDLMSKNEDADMAETFMYFKNAENIYRASLSVSSKAIQPTLVDFIK